MFSVAVIPARSGSKRIPNKNFIKVNGLSLVDHAIELAQAAGVFDEIIVSLDSWESAKLISSRVATLHVRSLDLASDQARTIDVIKEVITKRRIEFSTNLCCLYPTSLLLPKKRIVEGLSILKGNENRFVFAAQQAPSNPLRMFKLDSAKEEIIFLDQKSVRMNTQDLDPFYTDAGQFYWASETTWISQNEILSSTSVPVILNKWETIDIDSREDLDIVRDLLKIREGKQIDEST